MDDERSERLLALEARQRDLCAEYADMGLPHFVTWREGGDMHTLGTAATSNEEGHALLMKAARAWLDRPNPTVN